MKYMHIDLETYSSVPLPKTEVYPYAESGDFEILLFGASVDGGPVRVYDLAQGGEVPENVLAALTDDCVIKYAHNASFERICLSRYLRDKGVLGSGEYLHPEGWRCTMVWSAYAGLPLSLKTVGEALHLEEGKMDEGKDLIRFFCGPVKPTKANGGRTRNRPEDAPEKWELFKAYNRRDVEVEMRIAEKLSSLPVPDEVWQQYHESEANNDRGIAVDRALVRSAIRLDAMAQRALTEEMQAITDVGNPRSVQQMKEWLAQNGLEVESLGKKEVAALISTAPEPLRTVLTLRSEIAKSSVRKYTTMQNALCADGRLRGMFMFYGANRSGRFSGRIVQLQNLYRNSMPDLTEARALVRKGDYESIETLYDSVPGVLAECTRTAFIPSPGNHYVVADFSAIEARVLAWMAGETWREKVFEDGGDIYCASASQMFHVPVVKHGENGHLRQKGKVAELALGYGGSVGALRAMGALEMGLEEEELQPLVDAWRTANPRIVQFWWNIDRAVKQAVQEQTACRVGCLTYRYGRGFLFIQLPSGRRLCYAHPCIDSNRFGGESIEYMGMDATKHWGRAESYWPKFVENCIAEGSLVITDQGPVPIERVTPGMKVWDGEQYVAHSGVACKGVQPTICVDGLRMTPRHRILSSAGWIEARRAPGLHWMDFLMGPNRYLIRVDYEVKPILTKSVSPFARNTVDSLTTIRKLKEHGTEVFFEKENIWTFDSKGELLLTIMSSLAQEESRSISLNVTWGQRKRFADGKASAPFSVFLGYDRGEHGEFVVNPEQAEIIKIIYGEFLKGFSFKAIAKKLTAMGIKTPKGREVWSESTVKSILTNEKYKGCALLQKRYTADYLTKKVVKNDGAVPQYYVEDCHECCPYVNTNAPP